MKIVFAITRFGTRPETTVSILLVQEPLRFPALSGVYPRRVTMTQDLSGLKRPIDTGPAIVGNAVKGDFGARGGT